MNILITGAYGFLGSSLCKFLERQGHNVGRTGRQASAQFRFQPDDPATFFQVIEKFNPDVLINLIAMTNVDACEREPATAYWANAGILNSIGTLLQRAPSIHLIHLSTDQVYDGQGPHVETRVAPLNVYAITKLAGEMLAERLGATVLRVNFVGRSQSTERIGLTDWIVESLRQKKNITLFNDVFFSPLHMSSLSKAIESAAMKRIPGVFNLGARDGLSKADFGIQLAKQLQLPIDHMNIDSIKAAKMDARRPKNMIMDSTRFEHTFGFELPRIDEEITRLALNYTSLRGGVL